MWVKEIWSSRRCDDMIPKAWLKSSLSKTVGERFLKCPVRAKVAMLRKSVESSCGLIPQNVFGVRYFGMHYRDSSAGGAGPSDAIPPTYKPL